MEKSDIQLIEEFFAGNEAAFELIVTRYLSLVFGFVYQLTRDRDVAEDVTQETFVKAWKHLARFDRDQKFKTWLYTIAKRTAYDALKKKKHLPFSLFEDAEGNNFLNETADEESIVKLLEQKDATRVLDTALAKLPLIYQVILNLHYRGDLSLQEIAEILDESYNTVKSRHVRGLLKLKEVLLKQ